METSEDEKEEESPKPPFLRETLSGRNPKPPKRYSSIRHQYFLLKSIGWCGVITVGRGVITVSTMHGINLAIICEAESITL